MNTIQLQGEVSFEQYQIAVNLLEKIVGLKVVKAESASNEIHPELLEMLENSEKDIKAGRIISNEEVQKQALELYNG